MLMSGLTNGLKHGMGEHSEEKSILKQRKTKAPTSAPRGLNPCGEHPERYSTISDNHSA